MHGRPRKRESDGSSDEKEKTKIALLEPLLAEVLRNHHDRCYTKEALQKNARFLELNPEVNTAWNYRKLALRHLMAVNPDVEVHKVLAREELRVIQIALARNLKSYGAWHHRKWVISLGFSSLDNEFYLLDKLMEVDARNFLAWAYRRHVDAIQGTDLGKELEFTKKIIYENFSNYSAWHNRSTLLSQVLKQNEGNKVKESTLSTEFELVRQAFFTEPDDQSAWFYYNWLLGQATTALKLRLLHVWPSDALVVTVDEQTCPSIRLRFNGISGLEEIVHLQAVPIFLCFSRPVTGVNDVTVSVKVVPEFKEALHTAWRPVTNDRGGSSIWSMDLKVPTDALVKTGGSEVVYTVVITIGSTEGIVSEDGYPLVESVTSTFQVMLFVLLASNSTEVCENVRNIHVKHVETRNLETFPEQSCTPNKQKTVGNITWNERLIQEEIEMCRELVELESNSKWANLTLARLLTIQQTIMQDNRPPSLSNMAEVLQLYEKLKELDPLHKDYYCDQYSMNLLDQITADSGQLRQCWSRAPDESSLGSINGFLQLKGLSLSKLGSMERLLSLQMLDLSCNSLRALDGLEALQLLVHLNVSHNLLSHIHSLRSIWSLQCLRSLDISFNKFTTNAHQNSGVSVAVSWALSSEDRNAVPLSGKFEYLNDVTLVFSHLKLEELWIAGNPSALDSWFRSSLMAALPSLKKLDAEILCN